MAEVLLWQPGTLKQPGDLVRPTNSGVVSQTPLENGNFDEGNSGWTSTGSGIWTIDTTAPVFNGTYSGKVLLDDGNTRTVTNDEVLTCVPGQIVVVRGFVYGPVGSGDPSRVQLRIQWYNASMQPLAPSNLALDNTLIGSEIRIDQFGLIQYACREIWLPLETEGIAPAEAAFFQVQWIFRGGNMPFVVDQTSIDYANVEDANVLLFRAVQAQAGFTGNNEPTWPTSLGLTVVDNEVTWEAVSGTNVTWQASRILVSECPVSNEDVEPDWPLTVNGSVPDGSIVWQLDSRQVTDSKVPQTSEIIALAASKVYAGDDDIIRYSATVNPLDWSTAEDAGYIPFGLNLYGANPATAMGLYRGNLAVFNSQGCQIWQVDPDPTAITLLDAIPIPCTYPKSLAPVGDDLAFLTNLGIRSLGVAGAQVNLAGGYFGKQVDPLVVAAIAEALDEGWTPRGLYWPAHGQYWLFFGPQAFVLTINGPAREQRSWSRYIFPEAVDDWTIMGTDLVLRAGELVWRMDPDARCDDVHDEEQAFGNLGALTLGNAADGYAQGVSSLELDDTFTAEDGTPVYLFGVSVTGGFDDLTITGAANATSVTASASVTADAGDVVVLKYEAVGPFTVVDGNEVGSLEIELSAGLTSYLAAGTILAITHSGGTDYNYLAEAVASGETTIALSAELAHEAISVLVYPVGTMFLNELDDTIAYVPIQLAAPASGTALTLATGLPAAAVAFEAIVCPFQATTVAGGSGTSTLELTDTTDFEVSVGSTTRVDFTASGSWQVPADVTELDMLVVGGGGGGNDLANSASDGIPGGGGGGGVLVSLAVPVTPLESLTITVGAGGSGGGSLSYSNGQPSEILRGFTVLATAGGGITGDPSQFPVQDGGDSGTLQSNAGGAGFDNSGGFGGDGAGGGGAGAGAAGGAALTNAAGNGGNGLTPAGDWGTDIGDNGVFGGGGGGMYFNGIVATPGSEGTGTGAANTGGGATAIASFGEGAAGYSGFVAVRYTTGGAEPPEPGFPAVLALISPFETIEECEPFTSVIQWPFLDMNNLAVDKELVGFDLSIEGACQVTFGYDQRFLDYDAAGPWTTLFEVDGDTMPGSMTIPFSLTAPSFAMRLTFESRQDWKWYSTQLYIKDLTQ